MSKTVKFARVPRRVADPIGYLLDHGQTVPQLAVSWGLRSSDGVYRLRRFEYVPKQKTAAAMARSFGWKTGEVLSFWASRVEEKAS